MSEGVHDEALVTRLFDEFLRAIEEGRDLGDELLARAGPAAPALRARIALWEELGGLDEDAEPPAPVQLGRFHILRELGHGGLGRVYLAHDPRLARRVALKVLDGAVATPGEDTASVLNEARAVARLDHPGIVKVHEVTQEGHRAIIVMEYVPGPSLARVVAAMRGQVAGNGDATVPKAAAEHFAAFRPRIECLARIAEALAYCHDHGVLHRDIKPGNVLLDAENRPKLIDFGLAHDAAADDDSRTHLTQRLVGTAANVAPEQVADGRSGANPRSDQFSFSTLAYELVALANPFDCGHRRRTLDAIERCRPRPLRDAQPAVPPDLHRVIHHGLEREPDDRYPDMAAMAGDLRAILESRPITIVAPSLPRVLRLWARRHRNAVRVAILIGAISLLAAFALWASTTLATRLQVLAELGTIEPDSFEQPGDLEESFQPLLDAKQRAEEFDRGWLRSLVWGSLHPKVEAVMHGWSGRLGWMYARDARLGEESGIHVQKYAYRQLFLRDEWLCPECPYNRAERCRGLVDLPVSAGEETALYRLSVVEAPNELRLVFRPSTLSRSLAPGYYRWIAWLPGARTLSREAEFLVDQDWGPELVVEAFPPRADLRGSRRIEASRHQHKKGTRLLPAYFVMEDLVTNEQFDRFLAETKYKPVFRERETKLLAYEPSGPAWVDLESALRFAQWAGGRVPSFLELKLAVDQGVFVPRLGPRAAGEHVIDRSSDGELSMISSALYLSPSDELVFRYNPDFRVPTMQFVVPGDKDTLTPVGFRLVFSADRPEAYAEAGRP